MELLKTSRGAKFLAAGAAVAAIGMGSGGWALAASSAHAPTLIPVHRPAVIKVVPARPGIKISPAGDCPTLTPVTSGPAPTVPGTGNPAPVTDTPVVCGAEGTTNG